MVPFAFNMEKFPSLKNFYTHAVTGVTENDQVCTFSKSVPSKFPIWPKIGNGSLIDCRTCRQFV